MNRAIVTLAIEFPDAILALHIAAVVAGFGTGFGYPVLTTVVRRSDPRALPALHRGQIAAGQVLTGPALGTILLSGLYLAGHDHAFGQVWVLWAIGAVLAIGLIGALAVRPATARLLGLAERDLATANPTETPSLSPEYLAQARLVATIGWTINAVILLTVFDMAVKPFS
jgi:hypothetical protein